MSGGRQIKNTPFCWQSKKALRAIGEHFSESNKVPSARSVYLALCELASNEGRETFQVKTETVARFAGVGVRTVQSVLPELELIDLVSIDRQTVVGSKMDAPSIYTLLAVHADAADGNDCGAVRNDCGAVRNDRKQHSVAENQKNSEKNSEKKVSKENSCSPSANGTGAFSAEVVEGIYHVYPRAVGKASAVKAITKALHQISKRGQADPAGWLTERVAAFAATPAGKRGKYTPHPATWFNGGRYDDNPAEWLGEGNGASTSMTTTPARSPKDVDLGNARMAYYGATRKMPFELTDDQVLAWHVEHNRTLQGGENNGRH